MKQIDLSAIDLNLLVALDALLREGSVTRAARRCGVGQSAMSHSLRRLRDLLRDPLLVRDGRRMVPTPRAAALAAPLSRLLADARRLISHETVFEPAASTRRFSLVCPDLIGAVLPALIGEIERSAPGVELAVRAPGGSVSAALRDGGDDLGLGPPPTHSAGLMQRRLGAVQWAVLMRRGHPAADVWSLEAWLAQPHVVVGTGSAGPSMVETALKAAGHRRRVGLVAPSFLVGPLVAARSDWFFTAPAPFVGELARTLRLTLRPVPLPVPAVPVVMTWPERLHADAGHRWLRDVVGRTIAAAVSG